MEVPKNTRKDFKNLPSLTGIVPEPETESVANPLDGVPRGFIDNRCFDPKLKERSLSMEFTSFSDETLHLNSEAIAPIKGRVIVSIEKHFDDEHGTKPYQDDDTNGELIVIKFDEGWSLEISSAGTFREDFDEFVNELTGKVFSDLVIKEYTSQLDENEERRITNYFSTIQLEDSFFDFSISGENSVYYGYPPFIKVKKELSGTEIHALRQLNHEKTWGECIALAEHIEKNGGTYYVWKKSGSYSNFLGGVFVQPNPNSLTYQTNSGKKNDFRRPFLVYEIKVERWKETPYGRYPIFSLSKYSGGDRIGDKVIFDETNATGITSVPFPPSEILSIIRAGL